MTNSIIIILTISWQSNHIRLTPPDLLTDTAEKGTGYNYLHFLLSEASPECPPLKEMGCSGWHLQTTHPANTRCVFADTSNLPCRRGSSSGSAHAPWFLRARAALLTQFGSFPQQRDHHRRVATADGSVQRPHPAVVDVLDRCSFLYQILHLREETGQP